MSLYHQCFLTYISLSVSRDDRAKHGSNASIYKYTKNTPTKCMGFESEKSIGYGVSERYGLWVAIPCIPTW